MLGLYDALDRGGIPLATSSREFDAELALAHGMFQRTAPDWRVYTADPGMERAMRRLRQREAMLSAVSVAGLVALDLFTTGQIIAPLPPGSPERGSLIMGGVILFALLMGALTPVWLRIPSILRLARLHGDILRDYQAPELLVITPRGIAYHVVDEARGGKRGRGASAEPAPFETQQGFLAGGVAFSDMAGVERARGRRGASLLRLRMASGEVRDLPISNFASEGDVAAIAAIAAFRARSER